MKNLHDDSIEEPEVVKDPEPKQRHVITPKDNTLTIVLLVLITLVIGFIYWYNTKNNEKSN